MTQSIGPPSLAQGTRIAVGFSTSISRFIPACGELSKPSWAIVQLDGSSPLARGTLGGSDIRAGLCRFIPACAGNSYERKKVTEYTSVHPRLRGELGPHIGSRIGFIGSSPLTRGTPPEKFYDGVRSRFIPAYAGNSSVLINKAFLLAVHPRLRGELKRPR